MPAFRLQDVQSCGPSPLFHEYPSHDGHARARIRRLESIIMACCDNVGQPKSLNRSVGEEGYVEFIRKPGCTNEVHVIEERF